MPECTHIEIKIVWLLSGICAAIKVRATAWKWIFVIAVSERTENEINIKQCVTFFATKQRQRAGSQDMWNQQPHLVKIVCRNGCIYVAKTNSQQGAASKKLNKQTWHKNIHKKKHNITKQRNRRRNPEEN